MSSCLPPLPADLCAAGLACGDFRVCDFSASGGIDGDRDRVSTDSARCGIVGDRDLGCCEPAAALGARS